jgi:predicted phosphodiesterase
VILWISDLHTSTEPPPHRTTRPFYDVAFRKIRHLLAEYRPDAILCGGDVFHSRRAARPNPSVGQILALRHFIDGLGVPWTCLAGNHDIAYDDRGARHLSPLSLLESPWFNVVWDTALGPEGVRCVAYHGDDPLPGDPEARVVALHDSYHPRQFAFEVKPAEALVALYPAAELILCGHIHAPASTTLSNGARFLNTGPLIRRSRDELEAAESGYAALIQGAKATVVPTLAVDDWVVEPEKVGLTFDVSKVIQEGAEYRPITEQTVAAELEEYIAESGELVDDETIEECVRLIAGGGR